MCEMIFTSDKEFFDTIGIEETKRYFEESYKFICNYKNLGEKNIISAVVHFDEIFHSDGLPADDQQVFSFVLKGSSYGIYRQSTEVTAPLLLTL